MNSPEKSKRETKAVKKRYASPVIHSYGAVRAITMNVGMTGMIDGGGKNPKTGP